MRLFKQVALPFLVILGMMFGAAGASVAQDDNKPTVVVGSKNYTESILQGEIVAQLLEANGYEVERQFDLGGTGVVFSALQSGEVDTFVEWTGTALSAVLELPVPEGDTREDVSAATYDLAKAEYEAQFGITWLAHWGYNNTYAMTVTQETADELGLEKTSDLAPYAADMTLGTDQEFPVRADGLPGFEEAYGIEFGDVTPGDQGLMYGAVANGDVDVITAYTTDGRIAALDLVVLEDDLGFFPPYNPAPIFQQEFLDENPEVAEILNQLDGAFTESEIAALNYQVDEEGAVPADVVTAFLTEKGLLGGEE